MSEVQRGNTVIEAKDLRPGEEILWQSATEPIGLLEGSCGKQIIKSWIIITVITLALVIACTAVIGSIQFKLLAVVAVVWLCIMMAPVADRKGAAVCCDQSAGHRCPEGQDHVHHGAWQGG